MACLHACEHWWIHVSKCACQIQISSQTSLLKHLGALVILARWRRCAVGGMATMESLCLQNGRLFSFEHQEDFRIAYVVYRSCLNRLAEHALASKQLRYHVRPKLHMLGKLAYKFLPKNPRHMSCYLDEDFVARTKKVCERLHPVHMSRLMLYSYAVQVCLKWDGR